VRSDVAQVSFRAKVLDQGRPCEERAGRNGRDGKPISRWPRAPGSAHTRIKRPATSLDRMVSACYRARVELRAWPP
jgi:hypothetical protein